MELLRLGAEREGNNMTLEKLLEIVRQKRINAQIDIDANHWFDKYEMHELMGQRDAYLDIESLISFCIEENED